ncbi:MAG: type II toxin-antitoxin system VapB family antitoxin [Armatimonadetes bacterium]|nr:type II toxin-antitoxin system VapB family antitoxin [Armatimonadota bacterium]
MALNIKNEEAHRLATEIALETGVSLTEAVILALREKRERLVDKQARYKALRAIALDCAARFSPEELSLTHGDLLYGEMGLPR